MHNDSGDGEVERLGRAFLVWFTWRSSLFGPQWRPILRDPWSARPTHSCTIE